MGQSPWSRTKIDSPPNAVIHSHQENTRFDKICHPWSWWSFWHMWKVRLCVISFCRVRLWMCHITSNFCTIAKIFQLWRNIQKWLKMSSSFILMLQPTQQTPLRMFSGTGAGSVTTSSLFYWSQSRLTQPLSEIQFANKGTFWRSSAKWDRLAH